MAPYKSTLLSCPAAGCSRMFKNKSGLTKHARTYHSKASRNRQIFHQAAPTFRSPSPEAWPGYDHLDFDGSNPDAEFEVQEDFGGPNPDAEFEIQEGYVPQDGTWVELGPLFRVFHPSLTGLKCDAEGDLIDQNAPPPPRTDALQDDWTPYESRIAFETADFLFSRNQTSAKQIDTLLDLWAASLIKHDDAPPFTDHRDLYNTIDATPLGNVPWETFSMSYTGAKPLHDIPPWMDVTYDVWFRDPCLLLHDMLGNPDFNGEMEYVPYRDYTAGDKRCFKNLFSGDWAWRQADIIAQNEANDGSTFVPLIIGSDKTTVSVATGHTEYHPLYMSIGNIFNNTRRAHRNGVVLVGFLAIPKTTKEHAGDTDYRNFRRQMFHCSLTKIFDAIKPYMDTPDVARFPDGHFCRVIYGLGPYIADYPEQVLLSGVVQGWCPKCLADRRDLDSDEPCLRRCEKHRELLVEELEYGKLWEEYGIVGDLVPFMNDYPRADIHDLISPDILHQIIKGTFKDHLVDWVESYLKITHGTSYATQIMDDIDNKQVYLPTISGHVPDDIVRTFSTFLDFCYIVRCDMLTEDNLLQLQNALDQFHRLCSSIIESKHIKAVKEPWRCSSRFKALGQMLLTNQRLDKLAAARVDFQARGMLKGSCLSEALHMLQNPGETVDGPAVEAHVDLAATPRCRCDVRTLSEELELPNFPQLIQEFIHDQAHAADPDPPVFDPLSAPLFLGKVAVFNSAAASFYAPSDLSSVGGMQHEYIRALPCWHGGAPQYDCVFVDMDTDTDVMNGLAIARVLCFFSFSHRTSFFQCAVVRWFSHVLDARDPDTGMYVVAPATLEDDTPDISIIHIDCIFRAAHLIPLYGSNFLPRAVTSHDSYDVFRSYFVNKYADHHTFEIA
ncbi:hypothetical protein EDD22DRAFT_982701 [Suillus occidentalis]|nr:hypothetical protein EDD22DRAFT_982701 [Suillus occidentalis]